MKKLSIAGGMLLMACSLLSCSRKETEPEGKDIGKPQTDGHKKTGPVDREFIATMKTLSVYDRVLEPSAKIILDDFDRRYTSPEAKRVLRVARRMWFPDSQSGAVVSSEGFVRAAGHTFRFQRGKISKADRKFMEAYARCLAVPEAERGKIKRSIPTEGVSEHLRTMLENSIDSGGRDTTGDSE